jgi:hypothetical protein
LAARAAVAGWYPASTACRISGGNGGRFKAPDSRHDSENEYWGQKSNKLLREHHDNLLKYLTKFPINDFQQ